MKSSSTGLPGRSGLGIKLGAVALAAVGQALVHTAPRFSLLGLALGGALFFVAERRTPPGEEPGPLPPARTARSVWWLFLAGAALCFAAGAAVRQGASPAVTHGVWLSGLGFLVASALRSWWSGRSWPRPSRKVLAALVLLLAVSAGLFAWNVATIPPEVHGDDAEVGNDALRLLGEKPFNLFRIGWFQLPLFHAAPTALGLELFGTNLTGLRSRSVALGMASVLLLFALGRRLWGLEVAVLAGLLLASQRFFIHLSRAGYHYVDTPFLSLLVVWLLLRVWRDGRMGAAIWCGIALGLGVQTYYASRLVPVLVTLTWLIWLVGSDRALLRQRFGRLAVIVASAFATAAPMIAYFSRYPGWLWTRIQTTSVFSSGVMDHLSHSYGTDDLGAILLIQAGKALALFNASGDTSLQYGYGQPLLEPLSAALFVLGVAAACARIRARRNHLLLLWIVIPVLAGGALTSDAPFFPRISGAVPFAALAVALALHGLLRSLRDALPAPAGRQIAALVAAAVLGLVFVNNIRSYFLDYAPNHRHSPAVEIAAWIRAHGAGKTTYMVGGAPWFFIRHGTIRFLAHGYATGDIIDLDSHLREQRLDPATSLFVIMPRGRDLIPKLTAAIGPLDVRPHFNLHHAIHFYTAIPRHAGPGPRQPPARAAPEHRARSRFEDFVARGLRALRAQPLAGAALLALVALAAGGAGALARRRRRRGAAFAGPLRPEPGPLRRGWTAFRVFLFGPSEREHQFQPSRRLTAALLVLTVLGAIALRVYRLSDLPAGFYCDEAGLGYNAYSLLETGKDETGEFLPLYVWSFGVSYKNPVFIYSAIPPVATLGLTEFSVRLTSAVYGAATVVALFFLGRALMGPWVGLLAAVMLALCPWHLHFSRIAFELITFPFFFVLGTTCLVRYTRGRRRLPLAAFFMGSCLYTYGIAKLFVPLFLAGFALLFVRPLLSRWKESVLAAFVLALTVAPVIRFDLAHAERARRYFRTTTMLDENAPPRELARRFATNYAAFLSPKFLFRQGDPLVRHAVRGHGELYPFYAPLILTGIAAALLRRDRALRLPLWWLLIYPVGAALMNEIPSASRGFIGAPAFCLLGAIGAGAVLRLPAQLTGRRTIVIGLQWLLLAAGVTVLAPQVHRYWTLYTREYPRYSAKSFTGFQFGHREIVRYFLAHRDDYDGMVLSPLNNNQPQSFLLFYTAFPPAQLHRGGVSAVEREAKMLVDTPENLWLYQRYPRLLMAVLERELPVLAEYEVKKTVIAPDGSVANVIIEAHAPKDFVRTWRVAGPYPAADASPPPDPDPADPSDDGPGGRPWRRYNGAWVSVQLNDFFAPNVDAACAWAVNFVHSGRERTVGVFAGFDDRGEVWVNGAPVPLRTQVLRNGSLVDSEVGTTRLRAGRNTVAVRSCEVRDDWLFYFRLAEADGRKLDGVRWEY